MRMAFLAAAALAAAATGCAGPRLVGGPDLTVVDRTALPPPTREDLGTRGRLHVIGPFDQMAVDVFGVAELSRTVQADAAGRISLPLVGIIEAAGQTPQELATLVEQRLQGQYVRNPRVTVNMTSTVSHIITVDGEVREPGTYPVTGQMTLMRAIARAKGLTEFARASHVVIFRRVEGRDLAALYDLRAIRQGLYQDPEVYTNDVVMVGDSQARRLFRDVIQGSGLLTAPIIALLQQSTP